MENHKEKFRTFLINHGAYEEYQKETKKDFDDPNFLTNDAPASYLISEITWARTSKGYDYWKSLNTIWGMLLRSM